MKISTKKQYDVAKKELVGEIMYIYRDNPVILEKGIEKFLTTTFWPSTPSYKSFLIGKSKIYDWLFGRTDQELKKLQMKDTKK